MIGRKAKRGEREDLPFNPTRSNVVENSIRTLLRLRAQRSKERNVQDRPADGITYLSGR